MFNLWLNLPLTCAQLPATLYRLPRMISCSQSECNQFKWDNNPQYTFRTQGGSSWGLKEREAFLKITIKTVCINTIFIFYSKNMICVNCGPYLPCMVRWDNPMTIIHFSLIQSEWDRIAAEKLNDWLHTRFSLGWVKTVLITPCRIWIMLDKILRPESTNKRGSRHSTIIHDYLTRYYGSQILLLSWGY